MLQLLIALIGGVLMGLTVAPFGLWFLAWIALVPLWVLVVRAQQTPRVLLLACVWSLAYHGMALFWITGVHPMTWMGVPWLASLAIALFCWAFITFWGVGLVAIWATLIQRVTRTIQKYPFPAFSRILIGTAIWSGLEALWNLGPLDWTYLAYTQSPYNLAIVHLGQLSGCQTVTVAIIAVNGLLAEAWINRQVVKKARFYFTAATVLLITLHLIGFALYSRPLTKVPAAALKVGIVQGNVPNEIKLYPEGFRRAVEGYTDGYLTLVGQGVKAVLTPEGALPFFQDKIKRSSLVAAVREKGVVAWIGGFYKKESGSYTNSLLTVTGNGEIYSHFDKAKLVPIGEYVPFEKILGGIISRLSPLEEHQVPGSLKQTFDTPFGRAIAVICYGSAFPELFRYQAAQGGEFILSPSNDAHFSATMPYQHHAHDIMRAIETDRWAVRATNTGYSAFVDPHGRTLWISGHNTYETHAETIYRRQTQTLYVRWGNWLTPLLLVLAGGVFLGQVYLKRR